MEITQFGIGRVPTDVDPIREAMAEQEAEEIMRHHVKPTRVREFAPTGTTPGERPERGARCYCGTLAVGWNPGAGQHLCADHWDEY